MITKVQIVIDTLQEFARHNEALLGTILMVVLFLAVMYYANKIMKPGSGRK
jgi:hypothetical protein